MVKQVDLVRTVLFTRGLHGRWGLPLVLWGAPGTGKTSMLADLSRSLGLFYHCTVASICEPAELAGYAIPNEERTHVVPLPAAWVHRVAGAGAAVQHFDEITSCSGMAHSALMRIVLEGRAGDVELPPRVRFMAAANPTDVAANAHELAMPLANRFGHLHWDPGSADDWSSWLLERLSPSPSFEGSIAAYLEAQVLERWPTAFSAALGLVSTFIRRNPRLLHQQPHPDDPTASKAWPSRRTWEMAARAIAGADCHRLGQPEKFALVRAFVGEGAAKEFAQFVVHSDLPDVRQVLDGKEKFKHSAKRADRTLALLGSCSSLLLDRPDPGSLKSSEWLARLEAYWVLAWSVLKAGGGDIVVPSARMMTARGYDTDLLGEQSAAADVLAELSDLVRVVNRRS